MSFRVFALLALTALPASAVPVVQNSTFSGGFSGWTLVGYGDTTHNDNTSGFPVFLTANPGTNAATLYTVDPAGSGFGPGAISARNIESTLGLDPNSLNNINPPGPFSIYQPSSGTLLYQAITSGLAGDTITFDADFGYQISDNFFDFGFAALGDPTGTDQLVLTGSIAPAYPGPTKTNTFTLLRDATILNPLYLGFGVINTGEYDSGTGDYDANGLSDARFANIIVAAAAAAPEIDAQSATTPLAVLLLAGLLFGQRRRAAVIH